MVAFSFFVSQASAETVTLSANGRYFTKGNALAMHGINLFFVGYRWTSENNTESEFVTWLDQEFEKYAAHRISYVRIFLNMARQYDKTNKELKPSAIQHLNTVLTTAQRHGILINMAIFNENGDWNDADAHWTDQESQDIIIDVVDQWGSHSALGFWDLVNDIQMTRDSSEVQRWIDIMEPFLRAEDNNQHPILVQANTWVSFQQDGYKHLIEHIDGIPVRYYEDRLDEALDLLDLRIERELVSQKPVYVGEYRTTGSSTNPADSATSLATMHTLWAGYAGGAAGVHLWAEDKDQTGFPMLSDAEADYHLAVAEVLDRVQLPAHGFRRRNGFLSTNQSSVKTFGSMNAQNDRGFGYLKKAAGTSSPSQVTLSGLQNKTYEIEWISPTNGEVITIDQRSGTSFSLAPPFFEEDGLVVFVYVSGSEPPDTQAPASPSNLGVQ
jgi:hypothetical protein